MQPVPAATAIAMAVSLAAPFALSTPVLAVEVDWTPTETSTGGNSGALGRRRGRTT
jgi:hypothetical protein